MAKYKKPKAPADAERAPKVSVVVPMYNGERYMAFFLENFLKQTLQDFELIIVDDCSTDGSCAIVESFLPKFDGRLKLLKMPTNTGPAIPRNKGLEFSRGKYVYFMDSDDILLNRALEELYNLAEKFKAEVIYCEKYYQVDDIDGELSNSARVTGHPSLQFGKFLEKPTWVTDDFVIRVNDIMRMGIEAPPWLKFSRRDFLVKHRVQFPPLLRQDDNFFTLQVSLLAKKFLRVPNLCYVYRMHPQSLSVSKHLNVNRRLHKQMDKTIRGMQFADDFLDRFEFFEQHPEWRYALLDFYATNDFYAVLDVFKFEPDYASYEFFKREFREYMGEHSALISYLASKCISLTKNLAMALYQQKFSPPPSFGN